MSGNDSWYLLCAYKQFMINNMPPLPLVEKIDVNVPEDPPEWYNNEYNTSENEVSYMDDDQDITSDSEYESEFEREMSEESDNYISDGEGEYWETF